MADIIVIGPMGPTGPSGNPGKSGPTGSTGLGYYVLISGPCSPISGPMGISISGPSGFTGPSGFKGAQGPSGPSGFMGSNQNGPSGISGPSGARGHSGPSGIIGPVGLRGPSGRSGASPLYWFKRIINFSSVSGPTGLRGSSGPSGLPISGPTGYPGPSGAIGPSGIDGVISGPTGLKGPRGSTGPSGPGNYLRGPSGPTGPIGMRGPSGSTGFGVRGPSGKNGLFGFIKSDFLDSKYFVKISENSVMIKSANGVYNNTQGTTPEIINGNNLISIYNLKKTTNESFTIFLSKGNYDLGGQSLRLTSNNIKIIGLGTTKNDVVIQSALTKKGIGVLDQQTSTIYLENLTIVNSYVHPVNNFNEKTSYFSQNNNYFHRCAFSNSYTNIYSINSYGQISQFFRKVFIERDMSRPDFSGVPIQGDICFVSNNIDYSGAGFILVKETPTNEDINNFNLDFSAVPLDDPAKKIWKLYFANNIFLNGNSFSQQNTDKVYITSQFNKLSLVAIEVPSLNQEGYPYFSPWPWQVTNWGRVATNIAQFSIKINDIDNMKKSIFKNVYFKETMWSLGMAYASLYIGSFSDCVGDNFSFGGRSGYLIGDFKNCNGGYASFTFAVNGEKSIEKSKITNCKAGKYSFGGPEGQIDGIFRNLTIDSIPYPSIFPNIVNITPGSYSENIKVKKL